MTANVRSKFNLLEKENKKYSYTTKGQNKLIILNKFVS